MVPIVFLIQSARTEFRSGNNNLNINHLPKSD